MFNHSKYGGKGFGLTLGPSIKMATVLPVFALNKDGDNTACLTKKRAQEFTRRKERALHRLWETLECKHIRFSTGFPGRRAPKLTGLRGGG